MVGPVGPQLRPTRPLSLVTFLTPCGHRPIEIPQPNSLTRNRVCYRLPPVAIGYGGDFGGAYPKGRKPRGRHWTAAIRHARRGAAATVSLAQVVLAQQQATPVIGFLHGASPERFAPMVTALRQGLKEAGYVDGRNVAIEFRWAEGHYDRLPSLAAELVRRQVAVIITAGTLRHLRPRRRPSR